MSHPNASPIPLRGRSEILDRLEVADARDLLLVEAPQQLQDIVTKGLAPHQTLMAIESRAVRSVKDTFDWILVWQESRIGSRAVFASALKRLAPDGRLWAVTALRKVQGPRTPAAHRLEPGDLEKAFATERLSADREARLSAWHVAHRFTRKRIPS